MKKIFLIMSSLIIVLIFMTGCGPSYLTVRTPPPPPAYTRPAPPHGNYIWVDGEWIKSGHRYAYRNGYWAAPRPKYRQYVKGHWEQRRNGWYWVKGYWN